MKFKVTGYSIIVFLICIAIFYRIVLFEIDFYKECSIKNDYREFIGVHVSILIIILLILYFSDLLDPILNKIDKLLKKRIF